MDDIDLARQPVGVFARQAVCGTREGLLWLLSCVLLLVTTVAAITMGRRGYELLMLSGLTAFITFVLFLFICGPTFRSDRLKTAAMLAVVGGAWYALRPDSWL